MTTFAGYTEAVPVLRYDWNQDGSRMQGMAIVAVDAWVPRVGQTVVLHDEGIGVVTVVTRVTRSSSRDVWVVRTAYEGQAMGSIRAGAS